MQYLSHNQALDYVQRKAGLSKSTFNESIRPRLVERKHSDRVVRYARIALENALDDPTFEEVGVVLKKRTVEKVLEHTWDVIWSLQRGARHQRPHMDQIINDIGHKAIKKVNFSTLEKWTVQMRKRGLAESTIERRLSMLRKAMKVAQAKGWITEIPDKPQTVVRNIRERFLTREEVERLIVECQNSGPIGKRIMPHVIGFLVDTGARRSELMKLRWEHVANDGVIFDDRKAGGKIKVPTTSRARRAIHVLLRDEWWIAKREDLKSCGDWITQEFSRVSKRAKVTNCSPHTLRHTCGSWLAQGGMDLLKIQKWMGHAKVQMTAERYAHLRPSDLLGGVSIIESYESDNVRTLHKSG